jgi:hypothetical protein
LISATILLPSFQLNGFVVSEMMTGITSKSQPIGVSPPKTGETQGIRSMTRARMLHLTGIPSVECHGHQRQLRDKSRLVEEHRELTISAFIVFEVEFILMYWLTEFTSRHHARRSNETVTGANIPFNKVDLVY